MIAKFESLNLKSKIELETKIHKIDQSANMQLELKNLRDVMIHYERVIYEIIFAQHQKLMDYMQQLPQFFH